MALQDTRRGPYSGRALTREIDTGRQLTQRAKRKEKTRWEWRHQTKMNELNVGGVTTGLSEHLNKWVGNDKVKKPAVIEDKRNLGRYHAIKLLGRKREGVQRTILLVNVYVPQAQGEWAREITKRANGDPKRAGEVATTQLINDLTDMLRENNTPGTAIIIMGDLRRRARLL